MNRTELIGKVSEGAGLGRRESEAALDAVIYSITSAVRGGDTVRITGFGTFKPRDRAARMGRNPQTGAAVRIKASKGISFSAGATLKDHLNSRSALPKLAPVAKASAPAKKTTTKKAAAKKAAPKKAAAKKTAAKKAPARKTAAKKAPARKAAAKKAPAKRAVKKVVAKRAPAKKAVARRAPAKKAGARKR